MQEFNGNSPINLFDILCEWLDKDPRTNWQYSPSRYSSPDSMLGSIWITHYVVLHVYDRHVIVLYPYHSMHCSSITIEVIHPSFFDDLYDVLIKAIGDM